MRSNKMIFVVLLFLGAMTHLEGSGAKSGSKKKGSVKRYSSLTLTKEQSTAVEALSKTGAKKSSQAHASALADSESQASAALLLLNNEPQAPSDDDKYQMAEFLTRRSNKIKNKAQHSTPSESIGSAAAAPSETLSADDKKELQMALEDGLNSPCPAQSWAASAPIPHLHGDPK